MRFVIAFLVVWAAACGGDDVTVSDLAVRVDIAAPDHAVACTLTKPYSGSDVDCDACATAHCCVEINTCYGSAACDDDYTNCYLACGLFPDTDAGSSAVDACVAQCGSQYPLGKAQFQAAIGCAEQHCATECS